MSDIRWQNVISIFILSKRCEFVAVHIVLLVALGCITVNLVVLNFVL
jgi:hypothetical protein